MGRIPRIMSLSKRDCASPARAAFLHITTGPSWQWSPTRITWDKGLLIYGHYTPKGLKTCIIPTCLETMCLLLSDLLVVCRQIGPKPVYIGSWLVYIGWTWCCMFLTRSVDSFVIQYYNLAVKTRVMFLFVEDRQTVT